jgi:hypothetical protein
MDTMVLEKQDSGISLSMVGVDGHDGKMSDIDSVSTEHLHHLHAEHMHCHTDLANPDDHNHHHHNGHAVADSGEETHVPLHKTVCCSLCR